MAPSITETLYALGLGDRVVGVARDCHYPPEVEKRQEDRRRRRLLRSEPRGHPGAEARPGDYARGTSPGAAELRETQAGNARRFPSNGRRDHRVVPHYRRQVAARGREGRRWPAISRIASIASAEQTARAARVRACFSCSIGRSDCGHLSDLYVAADDNYIDTIIDWAGGQNAYRERGVRYPRRFDRRHLEAEPRRDRRPGAAGHGSQQLRPAGILLDDWNDVKGVAAVKNRRVLIFDRTTPAFPARGFSVRGGLAELPGQIHPRASGPAESP